MYATHGLCTRSYQRPAAGPVRYFCCLTPSCSEAQAGTRLLTRVCALVRRFAEVSKGGSDRVRKYEIGQPEIKLQYFEEVFTSEYWMTRIYRVLPEPPRQRAVPYTPAQAVDRVKPKTRSTSKRRDVSGQLARQAPS